MWLSNQFDLIRCLIQTNPRDQLVMSDPANPKPPALSNEKDIGVIGQKRSLDNRKPSGDSPDAKRNSSDLAAILEENGLPSDLQKMRKDQLVFELESRGLTEYSMKNLKNELVDALKAALLSGLAPSVRAAEDNQETVVAPVDVDVVEETILTGPAESLAVDTVVPSSTVAKEDVIARPSLVLSSLRDQVRSSVAASVVTVADLPVKNEEAELGARLQRHRETQSNRASLLNVVVNASASTSAEVISNIPKESCGGKIAELIERVDLLVTDDVPEATADELLEPASPVRVPLSPKRSVENPRSLIKAEGEHPKIQDTAKPTNLGTQLTFLEKDTGNTKIQVFVKLRSSNSDFNLLSVVYSTLE
jgi:hypothetical protein